ncbi:hypothetical protein [Methylobacterium marchantiae]|uniref:Uncharacterized protein n=1 Tax=Methylobacterium marchantiae TaxID=600331 RepID=A0ABW3X0I6_9HYPH|nr:hypothetical protein AIGOOFII_2640 [Methylobacterium marchantiae]
MSHTHRWSRYAHASKLGCLLGLGLACSQFAFPQAAEAQTIIASSYGHHGGSLQRFDESYAGPLIRGDYLGAPLTRFPRPTELVPSAWGYGTYGVPTVTGIRPASVGTPTVYVIDAPPRAERRVRNSGPRIVSRNRRGPVSKADIPPASPVAASTQAGAKIVTVSVGRTASR